MLMAHVEIFGESRSRLKGGWRRGEERGRFYGLRWY